MNLPWYVLSHLVLRIIQMAFAAVAGLACWWIGCFLVDAYQSGSFEEVLGPSGAETMLMPSVLAAISILVVLVAEAIAIFGRYLRNEYR